MADLTELLSSLKTYVELPLEQARTLDPAFYTSKEWYELELEQIWRKEWLVVAHVADVRKPGDFVARDVVGEPMMIVRGEDMKIRALSTVCRHRFMPVVKHGERGNTTRFQCPYHRWTYGADGQLNQALYMEENRGFDMSKVCLPEFRLEIWHDLIWVNLDDDAPPLAPSLADLDESFSAFEVPENWIHADPYDKIWAANWKSCNENALESYHHMGLHISTVNLVYPTSLVRVHRRGENWTHHIAPLSVDRPENQQMLDDWKPGSQNQQEYGLDIYMIHPANAFVISPGSVSFYPFWPTSIETTHFQAGILVPPGGGRRDSAGEPVPRAQRWKGRSRTGARRGRHRDAAHPAGRAVEQAGRGLAESAGGEHPPLEPVVRPHRPGPRDVATSLRTCPPR